MRACGSRRTGAGIGGKRSEDTGCARNGQLEEIRLSWNQRRSKENEKNTLKNAHGYESDITLRGGGGER